MVRIDFWDLSYTFHKQVTNVLEACFCHPTVVNLDVSLYYHKFSEVHTFRGGTYFLPGSIFFRRYLPLALEVYNGLLIDSLGVMAVGEIRKPLFGLTRDMCICLWANLVNILTSFLPSPSWFMEKWGLRWVYLTLFVPTSPEFLTLVCSCGNRFSWVHEIMHGDVRIYEE